MYDENVGANEGLAAREKRIAGKEEALADF
jgi:hypothetical protein